MNDPCTQAILHVIRKAGFDVVVSPGSVAAVDRDTGERYIVNGEDTYEAACELALMLGFDLEE